MSLKRTKWFRHVSFPYVGGLWLKLYLLTLLPFLVICRVVILWKFGRFLWIIRHFARRLCYLLSVIDQKNVYLINIKWYNNPFIIDIFFIKMNFGYISNNKLHVHILQSQVWLRPMIFIQISYNEVSFGLDMSITAFEKRLIPRTGGTIKP